MLLCCVEPRTVVVVVVLLSEATRDRQGCFSCAKASPPSQGTTETWGTSPASPARSRPDPVASPSPFPSGDELCATPRGASTPSVSARGLPRRSTRLPSASWSYRFSAEGPRAGMPALPSPWEEAQTPRVREAPCRGSKRLFLTRPGGPTPVSSLLLLRPRDLPCPTRHA